MENVVFNTNEAVAKNSEAMEFRDHFKNEAKLKSHTSRENCKKGGFYVSIL